MEGFVSIRAGPSRFYFCLRCLVPQSSQHVCLSPTSAETYLSLRVLGIHHDPADFDHLGTILGHVDAMLVTRRGNVNHTVFFKGRRGGGLLRRVGSCSGDGRSSVACVRGGRGGGPAALGGGCRIAAAAVRLRLGRRGHGTGEDGGRGEDGGPRCECGREIPC